MTEQEWLACDDPMKLLAYLDGKASDRKLRQFAVACCSYIWPLLPDEGKRLVEAAERFGEETATRHERDAAVAAFRAVHGRYGPDTPALRAAYRCKDMVVDVGAASFTASCVALAASQAADADAESPTALAAHREQGATQVELLRCLFGNPFRPVALDPARLARNDGTVVKLAQAIYDERAFDRLPILADALEEAGCTDADILAHCRGPRPHARGCWCLDLLLNKD